MKEIDDNLELINITKGTDKNIEPTSKTDWDIMSSSMLNLVEIFFLPKQEFEISEPLKVLNDYIKKYDRLLYTILSDQIYEKYSRLEEKEIFILENIDFLFEKCTEQYCKENKVNIKILKKIILKMKDHTNLAIRQYRSLKQTDEEYNTKFNKQISIFKGKLTQEISSQLITLVGIFTAIAFVVFGGISSLGSIFSNISEKSIIKLIIASSVWGIFMFNMIFGFLLGISKMTGLNLGKSNAKDFVEKYILIFWVNAVMISIFLISLWGYFIFKSRILEELEFFPFRKFGFSVETFVTFGIIFYIFKWLKEKTKI